MWWGGCTVYFYPIWDCWSQTAYQALLTEYLVFFEWMRLLHSIDCLNCVLFVYSEIRTRRARRLNRTADDYTNSIYFSVSLLVNLGHHWTLLCCKFMECLLGFSHATPTFIFRPSLTRASKTNRNGVLRAKLHDTNDPLLQAAINAASRRFHETHRPGISIFFFFFFPILFFFFLHCSTLFPFRQFNKQFTLNTTLLFDITRACTKYVVNTLYMQNLFLLILMLDALWALIFRWIWNNPCITIA